MTTLFIPGIAGYAALVATGRSVFARAEIRRSLGRASGVALIGLGLLTALDANPRGR